MLATLHYINKLILFKSIYLILITLFNIIIRPLHIVLNILFFNNF